mmetsp:Transcript_17620/g.37240  ORF Transcript_17620/g.37240 Transcript_17620/m.37240 type:complete len:615 (+) Transcript_17620:126-1970(+)|eukprot:CAMPEP_0183709290 /NCGR_PEP_ID=MMETSP0737-20130205/5372_1 /TAXON_ID=385413 /ORGANISM="Thalassiosira miniscula, Strain CCMP1093" /LENGTH=614 /DNA_ID=CAMNT_0025937351 /DNA_START=73 /DNA_END=1917 /DNA_ORIENTATION=-
MADSSAPRPVVICGPSGVGKGTLIELLQKHFPPNKFGFSVSHTTRKPREGEEDGVHYNFTNVDDIKKEIAAGKFVEYAEVHGNYYGTSVDAVESVQNKNLICLLDIDIQGAQNVKKSTLDAFYLFIAPPSMEELEKRLRGRGTEKEDAIKRRLANAQGELDYGMEEGNFDAVLVNNDLDKTLEEMVGKFEEWFPKLLGETEPEENGFKSEDGIPPPIVDPLSFPKTEDGLNALLSEIDNDCPLEGYIQTELTYHASNINISAGKKLEIPLPPVEQNGSKIEWNVTVVDPYNERLDIDFGLFVIVDGEEVVAREMGRIMAPSPSDKSENGDKDDDATESSSTTGANDDNVSAKGKFTVANSAPVTVIMKLDNSFSWIKPKKINYSFNISAPVDDNMIQRSLRAKSVLPKILEGQAALEKTKAEETARKEAFGRIQAEMDEKMSGLNKEIENGKKGIDALQKRADEAEEEAKVKANEIKEALSLVKKEEQSIEECTQDIVALEAECARLKKKWEELKVERQVREDEKLEKEKEAEQNKVEREKLQDEIAAKKAEEQSATKELEALEKERLLLQDNLCDLGREKEAKEKDEAQCETDLKFLQKLINAVQQRFIEPKS